MPLRVLLLEEENSKDRTRQRFLEFAGCRVDCAHEVEEAEALFANFAYDVVVSETRLDAVRGSEGLRILSYVHEHSPATRTVLLTAFEPAEVEDEARNRGIEVFEPCQIAWLLMKAAS